MRHLIVVAVVSVVVGGCAPQSSQDDKIDTLMTDANPAIDEKVNLSLSDGSTEADAEEPERWIYTANTDPMSDEKTELACVQSSNTIYLSPPYGETGARLCLRNSPQFGREAYLSLNQDGQILCRSYESCQIRLRFDKAPADRWSAIGPSDGSSDIVFIEDRGELERQLRNTDTTHIQLEFYQNGMQTFTFNTADLKWGATPSSDAAVEDE